MNVQVTDRERFLGYMMSFSYLGVGMIFEEKNTSAEKSSWMGMTVMNVLGYFPGICVIVGIARIIFTQVSAIFTDLESQSKEEKAGILAVQEAQLVRGALECCAFLSPLLLISDALTTGVFIAVMMSSENS